MSKSKVTGLLLCAALLIVSRAADARTPRSALRPFAVPGEIVVALPAGESFAAGAHGEAMVRDGARAAVLAREGLSPVRLLGRSAGGGGARFNGHGAERGLGRRFAMLSSARPDFDPVKASAALRASGLFAAACPNYEVRLLETIPNDPYVSSQWHVRDVGGSDIRLPEAWDVTHGSASIVLAILDTGVDTGHPDLASKIWNNPGEIPGNAVDDDANGFVDDRQGWDFGDGDNDPNPAAMIDDIGLDEGFHGTFCAGIAGAATNNAAGIAGAGWDCRIMPLRIFNSAGFASSAGIAEAIGYAIDNGAGVISMSFGAPDQPGLPEYFQALVDLANSAGVVCVAAAGNDGTDAPLIYPAACDHVIAVGATTATNARADFSNWGSYVDVAAPGAAIWSSLCTNYVIDDLSQIFYIFFFGWDGENPYMSGDGTSFACPLVAGVCGLVRATHPAMTPDQMAAHLIATGDVVAYDHPIGPRVNAFRAVSTSVGVAASAARPARFELAVPAPNPSAGLANFRFTLPEDGPVEFIVFDTAGRRVRELITGFMPAGSHGALWDGADAAGQPVAAGVYFARLAQGGRVRVARIARLPR